MRRRTVAVLVACLAWSMASVAGAQTTTSSTSPSSSSTTTSSTSTTSTTVANPCTGRICTEDPPPAFLAGGNGEVPLDPSGFCWHSPRPNAQGHIEARCAHPLPPVPGAILVVRTGETLTLRFAGAMVPTAVVLERGNVSTPLTAGNPVRFPVELPVGVYQVTFSSRWLQGSATHIVRLNVRAAPRPLALTG